MVQIGESYKDNLFSILIIECTEGDIRLVGRLNSNEGRVEICIGNEYGTICDQAWDTTDASVVCRQLGLSNTGINYYVL